jgi:uncharacterized membrane protein
MGMLVLGLVLFLGVHSVSIVARGWRERVRAQVGGGPWRGLYSLVALAGFVLIAWGYDAARQDAVVLYTPFPMRHVTAALMLPVFPLVLAAYFPGRIKAAVGGHPMLVGTMLWALAHLLANGTLADLLLFGGFLAWAVADRWSFTRRPPQALKTAPPSGANDWLAVGIGLAAYVVFALWLHQPLIGVPAVVPAS